MTNKQFFKYLLFFTHITLFLILYKKRIVHESGEYYIRYDITEKKYIIYKDNIFRSKSIFEVDSWGVFNTNDLQKEVKSQLDEIYKVKMEKINGINFRLNILNEWDGYTTIQDKRDDKIKKVIG